jgi:signal transduction histidine kinase
VAGDETDAVKRASSSPVLSGVSKPVLADPDSVAIILENLMENAIKYNRPNGRIELVVSDADNWTNFTIGNSSEPIPPDRAAHIFDRFVRGSCGEEISGSGLGLSIARELAEANHGQLDLTSLAAGWTEFRLRLPNTTCADSPCCRT